MDAILAQLLHDDWQLLADASQQPNHTLHTFTIANTASEAINIYTVVLRDTHVTDYQLIFYTDIRSEKINEVKANKLVSTLFYDKDRQLQLIVKGEIQIDHQNVTSMSHWEKSGHKGRNSYLAELPPSTPVDEPTDGLSYLQGKSFDANSLEGYENFAVVTIKASFFEHLQLSRPNGNRRARFMRTGAEWLGSWIIP